MASITNRPKGHKWVQFFDGAGKRRTLRLGKCSRRDAEGIALRVDRLVNANIRNLPIDRDLLEWLGGIENQLHDRIVRCGLVEPREAMDLGDFITNYINGRTDLKPSTIQKYQNTKRQLLFPITLNTVIRVVSNKLSMGYFIIVCFP